jgi:hypothetical protein
MDQKTKYNLIPTEYNPKYYPDLRKGSAVEIIDMIVDDTTNEIIFMDVLTSFTRSIISKKAHQMRIDCLAPIYQFINLDLTSSVTRYQKSWQWQCVKLIMRKKLNGNQWLPAEYNITKLTKPWFKMYPNRCHPILCFDPCSSSSDC